MPVVGGHAGITILPLFSQVFFFFFEISIPLLIWMEKNWHILCKCCFKVEIINNIFLYW